MATNRSKSISKILQDSYVALYNSRHDPEILDALRPYHYDEAKLDQGLALYETARNLEATKSAKYGDQLGATQALHEAWRDAHRTYTYHRKLAKRIFKNDPAHINNLLLFERLPTKLSLWLAQSASFYHSILNNPDTLSAIQAHIPIPHSDFENAHAAVERVQILNNLQENKKAVAQSATQERDQALKALKDYLDQLKIVARYALGNDQRLELILNRPIPS